MSYIDALYKKDKDKIYVVERDPKKGRVFVEYDARYVFYYPDARGKHRSMTGEPLQRVMCQTNKEFIKEQRIRSNKQLYDCLLYTSPSPRDPKTSRMPSSA